MPEINLPTKAKQDAIKQDTEAILANFPVSGGTDWSKYKTWSAGGLITISPTILTSLFKFEGKGYVDHLSVSVGLGQSHTVPSQIQIIVDGNVYWDVSVGTHTQSSERTNVFFLSSILEPTSLTYTQMGVYNVPFVSSISTGASNTSIYLSSPLFFNSSIEIKIVRASNASNHNYAIKGGVSQ